VDQVSTWLSLLQNKSQVPDVYALDVIWPGILADYLIDLKPYVPAQEITAHFPDLIANDTVDGRLIACPITLIPAFCTIAPISCGGMDIRVHRKPGKSLKEWQYEYRRVSVPEARTIFGASSGKVLRVRL
jgi:hypothetical protein